VLSHRAVLNTFDWVTRSFEVGPGDRLLFVTSPCFDLSVYDTFGALVEQSDPAFAPRFTFTGLEFDPTLELYDAHARYYDPELGRFVSEDPLGLSAGDYNLTRYVGNNPVSRIDPSSLISDDVLNAVQLVADLAFDFSPIGLVVNGPKALGGAAGAVGGLVVGIAEGLAFVGKVAGAGVLEAIADVTGSETLDRIGNRWFDETLGPIADFKGQVSMLCAHQESQVYAQIKSEIGKAYDAFWDEYQSLLRQGKTVEASVWLAKPIGETVGTIFTPNAIGKAGEGAALLAKAGEIAGSLVAHVGTTTGRLLEQAAGAAARGVERLGDAVAQGIKTLATTLGKGAETKTTASLGAKAEALAGDAGGLSAKADEIRIAQAPTERVQQVLNEGQRLLDELEQQRIQRLWSKIDDVAEHARREQLARDLLVKIDKLAQEANIPLPGQPAPPAAAANSSDGAMSGFGLASRNTGRLWSSRRKSTRA